jgi:hypothetical protein
VSRACRAAIETTVLLDAVYTPVQPYWDNIRKLLYDDFDRFVS